MTRILFITILCIVVFVNALFAVEKTKNKLMDNYIAVFDLETQDVDKRLSRPLTESIRRELVTSGKFEVIDRGNMDKILAEQAFQMTGCVAGGCVVEAGQLLGVGKIITGSVSIIGRTYYLSLSLINVQSGKIEKVSEVKCKCEIDELIDSSKSLVNKLLGGAELVPQKMAPSTMDSLSSQKTKEKLGSSVGAKTRPSSNKDLAQGLVAYYPFNGNANDESGNNNGGRVSDGTLIGGVSFILGKIGQGLHFDGKTGEISLQHTSALDFGPTDSITIEAWVKPEVSSLGSNRMMVNLTYACTAESITTGLSTDGKLTFGIRDSLGRYFNVYSPLSIADGQWHHIAGVREVASHTAKLYLDGVLVDKQPDPTKGTFFRPDARDGIGSEPVPCPNKYFWIGDMDEVKIYKRALSSSEIQTSYLVGS